MSLTWRIRNRNNSTARFLKERFPNVKNLYPELHKTLDTRRYVEPPGNGEFQAIIGSAFDFVVRMHLAPGRNHPVVPAHISNVFSVAALSEETYQILSGEFLDQTEARGAHLIDGDSDECLEELVRRCIILGWLEEFHRAFVFANESSPLALSEMQSEAQVLALPPEAMVANLIDAYVADTGPQGAKWMIKQNLNPSDWNIFASPSAKMLLTLGFAGTRDHLIQELEAMGAKVAGHAINRIDFAMDFLTRDVFEPKLDQFVAHPNVTLRPEWSHDHRSARDQNKPSAITKGRRLESVTAGKMPGRQIIVYDKRREAIVKQKQFWFRAWGIDRHDPLAQVWRVEVRAGKKELKDRWNLRTFDDLEAAAGDVIVYALDQVRYHSDVQTDTNVTRQQLHPLWFGAQEVAGRELCSFRSGLTPGQLREIERVVAIELYGKGTYSHALGLAIAMGIPAGEMQRRLPQLMSDWIAQTIEREPAAHDRALTRMSNRLHFIQPG